MFNHPIELEIDGIIVRSPKVGGITRKAEKIWSSNTGRTASGRMQGTINAIKYTYSIEWPPLTQYEQELIESLISDKSKPFSVMRIKRPDGSVWELECYFGTPTFGEWNRIGGQWMSTGAKVDAIER